MKNKVLKKRLLILFLIATCKIGISQVHKGNIKVLPINESKLDSSVSSFLFDLKQIALNKDTSGLFKVLDSNVLVSYGAMQIGKKDFILNWQLDNPDSSAVWEEIIRIIKMGGVFDSLENKKVFCLPYANASKIITPIIESHKEIDFDPIYYLICLKNKAPVFSTPFPKSKIIGFLSYDLVLNNFQESTDKQVNSSNEKNWHSISTLDGKIKGWVLTDDFYPLGGTNIILEKINNQWKITKFFAFD